MSNTIGFHRHARRTIDRAVREGISALRDDPAAQSMFARVLWAAGQRSNLLLRGDVSVVAAALNLARFHAWHREPPETWAGGAGHVKLLIHSLAQHLLGRYPVPQVFGSAWFGDDSAPRDEERWWFIEHASGVPFRKIEGLPLTLTRKMERLLLRSPAHLSLRPAIRRAELLALGAEPELVAAILRTPLAEDFAHAEFWRGVFEWLIRHWDALEPGQVGPIVEFVRATRFDEHATWTPTYRAIMAQPDPRFSLTGRSPDAVWIMVQRWRYASSAVLLGRPPAGKTWAAAGWAGLLLREREQDPTAAVWEIVELVSSDSLQEEGRALRHCVASYVWRCVRRVSSIWTLRRASADGVFESRYTIEVEPRSRKIVQIRGRSNCRATGLPRRIIARWAAQERLHLLECA